MKGIRDDSLKEINRRIARCKGDKQTYSYITSGKLKQPRASFGRGQLAGDQHVHLDTDPMVPSSRDGPNPHIPVLLQEAAALPQTLPTV